MLPVGLRFGAFHLGAFELRRDRADDVRGDLILQLKHIIEGTLETVGPHARRSPRR